MIEEYEREEVDLAMSYLMGKINEIQLNYLCVKDQIDIARVKEVANRLLLRFNRIKNIGLIVLLAIAGVIIFKMLKW